MGISGSGVLGGNVTVPFIKGVAEFSDLTISKMGLDYIMEFWVSYPEMAQVQLSSIDGLPFEVGPRPLGLKFFDEPQLRKENTTFDVKVVVWDEAKDQSAKKGTLATFSWDCRIFLSAGQGSLTGETNATIEAGKNAGLNYDLQAECTSTEAGITVTARSAPFHVHDY